MNQLLSILHVKMFLLLGFISFSFGSIYKQFGIISFLLAILGFTLMILCIINISLRKHIDDKNGKNDV